MEKLFTFLLLWHTTFMPSLAQADWSLVLVGGGKEDLTSESMAHSKDEIHSAQEEFKIPSGKQIELFGDENGLRCITMQDATDLNEASTELKDLQPGACPKEVKDNRTEFLRNLLSEKAVSMRCNRLPTQKEKAMYGKGVSHFEVDPQLSDPRPGNKSSGVISGNATDKDLNNGFNRLLLDVKKGEHVSIFLADHGNKYIDPKTGATEWFIELGDGKILTVRSLKSVTEMLRTAGAYVHLSVDACKSGGFNDLTSTDGTGAGSVCTISSSNKDQIGMALEDLDPTQISLASRFRVYGNQLQAHACMLGAQQNNPAESSLDQIVSQWEKETRLPPVDPNCITDPKSISDLKKYAETVLATIGENSSEADQRRELISAFNSIFVTTVLSCARTGPSAAIKAVDMVSSCLDEFASAENANIRTKRPSSLPTGFNISDLKSTRDEFETVKDDLVSSYTVSHTHKMLNFLKNAPVNKLNEFKYAFCCLGYSFKTKKAPAICDQ